MTKQGELLARITQAAEDALVQLYIQHPGLVLDAPAKVACKAMFVMGCQVGADMISEMVKS